MDTDAVALQRLCMEDVSAFCPRDATLPDAVTLAGLPREPLVLAPRPADREVCDDHRHCVSVTGRLVCVRLAD